MAAPERFSYYWPVPPPPGFQGWSIDSEHHNRWTRPGGGDGAPLCYLFRWCRNENITYKLHLSPQFIRSRNIVVPTPLGRFSSVTSPYLSSEDIAGWWAELLLTNKVPTP